MQCFSRTERCWRCWQRSSLFSSSGRACFLQGKEVSFAKRQTSQGFWTCCRNRERVPLSLPYNRVRTRSWKKYITVKPGKPWTPEIFLESYCLAREKPIRHEKTKPQARTLVCGFVASSRVLIFALISHNTINILGILQVFMIFPVALQGHVKVQCTVYMCMYCCQDCH